MQRIGYRAAVARQAESLADSLSAAARFGAAADLAAFRGGPLALVGIGASYQVALAGARYWTELGVAAQALYPDELTAGAIAQLGGVVLLSASGESAEILDAAARAAALPRLAVCRAAPNPLAALCDAVLATESGADNGASSTGYTGMLLAMALLGRLLAEASVPATLTALPDTVARLIAGSAEAAARAAELLQACRAIDLVGGGIEFATACEGAILIREAVRVSASGWETRNYLHGPMESQDRNSGLIAVGAGREIGIANEAAGFAAASVLVTAATEVAPRERLCVVPVPALADPVAAAIASIVAVQMIAGEMQDAAGLTDTRFRYPQTDTKRRATA